MTHTDDPVFLSLKGIAQKGGDRGPLYDQGVLNVIEQIEQAGKYTKNRLVGLLNLYSLQHDAHTQLLTKDEEKQAQRFLAGRRWTIKEGLQYVDGVAFAEGVLVRFAGEK